MTEIFFLRGGITLEGAEALAVFALGIPTAADRKLLLAFINDEVGAVPVLGLRD